MTLEILSRQRAVAGVPEDFVWHLEIGCVCVCLCLYLSFSLSLSVPLPLCSSPSLFLQVLPGFQPRKALGGCLK